MSILRQVAAGQSFSKQRQFRLSSFGMLTRGFTLLFLAPVLMGIAWAQEREWFFDRGEDDAYLIFGVPDSDDVGISFWCGIASGEIRIFLPEADPAMKPDKDVFFILSAGSESYRIGGRTATNEMSATISVEAPVPAGHPLFAALQKSDRFKVEAGSVKHVYPLIDADVAGLLELCRKS